MPFLDWVNKNQAKETTREVPYHLLKQESVHGDLSGANAALTPANLIAKLWVMVVDDWVDQLAA